MANRVARHDTNTTRHDTIRHEHGWTRLPFVSCRVRRRAKTSTRTRHEGHRVVSCWHDNTTGPPCRVNTNTIHRKKFHQRQFFQVYNIQQHRFNHNSQIHNHRTSQNITETTQNITETIFSSLSWCNGCLIKNLSR
jgi:hypothetical protein